MWELSEWLSFESKVIARSRTYVEVLGVNLAVLGQVEVLLGDEHTLTEEVLVDRLAVGLGNQPWGVLVPLMHCNRKTRARYSHFGSGYCLVSWLEEG